MKKILWGRVGIAIAIFYLFISLITLIIKIEARKPKEEKITSQAMVYVSEPNVINNEISVCNNSSTKTYMDYRKITSKTSKQYKYIQANMKVNDKGFLVDEEGYIGIALGSYFGDIGSKYIITLSGGQALKVVKIEAKADIHTNNGCEQKWDKSVIEFVIDTDVASKHFGISSNGYIMNGNFNKHFKGTIEKIEVVIDWKQ